MLIVLRRALLRVLAITALVVAGSTVVFAAPAQASTDPVVVSTDGATWADNLPASLFGGVMIVPGKTYVRTFYVKNQTTLPGNLAVALRDVTGGDPNLIAALSLRAISGSHSGTNKPFTAAAPCVSLVSGVPLAGGQVVRVDVTLSLANSLSGVTSQSSVGRFTIPITLTSTDVHAPDGCGPSTPVTPPSGNNGGGGGGTSTPGTGTIGTIEISGAADGSVPPAETDNGELSGLGGKGSIRGTETIPNTGRFWQEFDVTGYAVALVLGGIFAWWWRRRDEEEEAYA